MNSTALWFVTIRLICSKVTYFHSCLSQVTSAEKSPLLSFMDLPSRTDFRMPGICATTANICSSPAEVMTEPSMMPRGGTKKPPTISMMIPTMMLLSRYTFIRKTLKSAPREVNIFCLFIKPACVAMRLSPAFVLTPLAVSGGRVRVCKGL